MISVLLEGSKDNYFLLMGLWRLCRLCKGHWRLSAVSWGRTRTWRAGPPRAEDTGSGSVVLLVS